MAQTYTRQSTFADGDTITAALFNDEYNQLVNAFAYSSTDATSTGHRHDGTAGQGGNIPKIGDLDFLNKIEVDSTNNRWGFYVEVSSAAVEQIRIQDGAIVPVTDNDIDLGTSSLEFKDLYIDGTANIDTLSVDTSATIAGLTVSGTSTLQGDVYLGNASADTIFVPGLFQANLIPENDSLWNLGSTSLYWANAYIDAITTTGNVTIGDTLGVTGATTLSSTLGVTGATTLSSTLAVTGTSTLTGNVTATNDLSIGGNLTVTGNATISGNLTFGDADTDSITLTADVASHITPDVDDTYDLGSSTKEWRNLYIDGTAYVDAINLNGTAITATAAELNIMDGVTATATEINLLDGVTSTTAELNILDGVTATTAELNILDGVTATAAELNVLDGVTAFVDEDNMSSNSATSIPSQQSVKAYVDSQVTAQDLDFQGDSGGALSIDLDSETLTIAGGTGIDTTGATNTLTVAIDSTVATLTGTQTLTNKTLTSPDVNTPDIDGGTIDNTVIGGTTAAAGTFTTFTSTGIDDNATSTAITIDSSENSTFSGNIVVNKANPAIQLTTTGSNAYIDQNTSGATLNLRTRASGGTLNNWLTVYEDADVNFAGNVGIGTTSPSTSLDVVRAGTMPLRVQSTSGTECQINMVNTGGNVQLEAHSGNFNIDADAVGIGTTSPSFSLEIGNGTASPVVSILSGTTNTGNIYFGDGTSGAEQYRGVIRYDHTNDFMSYWTGSSERMRIDSSGDVGFNTASPNLHGWAKAVTLNTATNAGYELGQSGTKYGAFALQADGRVQITNFTANPLTFQTNNVERMRIDSSGNVGIGTSSPTTYSYAPELVIDTGTSGGITVKSGSAGYGAIFFADGTSGDEQYRGFIQYNHNYTGVEDSLLFGTSGVEAMRISSNGQLKIGGTTNSPANVPAVLFGTGNASLIYDTGHTGLHINNENATAGVDNYGAGISFGRFASNSDDQSAAIVPVQTTSDQDHMGLAFLTHNTNTRANPLVEKMRLDADGNLGLGTDDPSRLLHLKAADSCLLQLEVGNTTGNCQILFGDSGSTTVGKVLYYHSGNALAFETNSAERMRIDSVGNLGIGNTSPSTIVGNISGSATGLAIESAVPVFALKDTSASDDISYIYQSTNDMRFLNYAGGEMTFRRGSGGTESMRIDSSGHLIAPNGITLGTSAGVYNAANTLDDYEEGTWTPTVSQGSATFTGARYVKVGRLVYAEVLVTAFTNRTTAANIQVGGLPFTSSSDSRAGNVSLSRHINRSSGTIVSFMGTSRSYLNFYALATNADYEVLYHSHLSSTNSNIYISITYETT